MISLATIMAVIPFVIIIAVILYTIYSMEMNMDVENSNDVWATRIANILLIVFIAWMIWGIMYIAEL